MNLILKWQLQLHWDWHWDWSVILELLILILWSHSAHIATEIGIDTESEKMAVIVLNIVKIFNLFNPYLSFCCSYVAKILNFAQYFLNTTETFADKHCIKEPRLILWLNFDWSFTEIETEAEVSILVILRLKLMLNLECCSYWYWSWYWITYHEIFAIEFAVEFQFWNYWNRTDFNILGLCSPASPPLKFDVWTTIKVNTFLCVMIFDTF